MSTDLATTIARDLIDAIADEIVRDPAIRLRVARRLRDEIVEIEHRMVNERRCEADEPPASQSRHELRPKRNGD